jgi:hypothetical protein
MYINHADEPTTAISIIMHEYAPATTSAKYQHTVIFVAISFLPGFGVQVYNCQAVPSLGQDLAMTG